MAEPDEQSSPAGSNLPAVPQPPAAPPAVSDSDSGTPAPVPAPVTPNKMVKAKRAMVAKLDAGVSRVDKPWVWPLVTTAGGVPLALAFGPGSVVWAIVLIAIGAIFVAFGSWASSRHGTRVKSLEKELATEKSDRADEVAEIESRQQDVVSELEVARAALNETRSTLDEVVERMLKRKYVAHELTSDDRMTWLLVGADHLRVVGRHCHDPKYKDVNTFRYPLDFGLMGRAVARREPVSVSLKVTPTKTYEKAQERFGRLDGSKVPELGMRSVEYRVVPLIDQTGLNVLGVVVLESLTAGTTRLDDLADVLHDPDTNGTIVDVLEVLAQAPEPGTEGT